MKTRKKIFVAISRDLAAGVIDRFTYIRIENRLKRSFKN